MDIYDKAIETFGKNAQMTKCIEELSELTKELCKDINNRGNRDNIVEELADVENTLEQVKRVYDIDRMELGEARNAKLSRLMEKIQRINMDRLGSH